MKTFYQFVESAESHEYFHGTSSRVLDKILASGLIPHATPKKSDIEVTPETGDRLNSVFLTSHYPSARDYADVAAHKLTGHPRRVGGNYTARPTAQCSQRRSG